MVSAPFTLCENSVYTESIAINMCDKTKPRKLREYSLLNTDEDLFCKKQEKWIVILCKKG